MIPNFDALWPVVLYLAGLAVCIVIAVITSFRVRRIDDAVVARGKAENIEYVFWIYVPVGGFAALVVSSILTQGLVLPVVAFVAGFIALAVTCAYVCTQPTMSDGYSLQGFAMIRTWVVFMLVYGVLFAGVLSMIAPSLPKTFFYSADGTKTVTYYRGDGFAPVEHEVRNELVGVVSVKTSGKFVSAGDPVYEWVERTSGGEVRPIYKKSSGDLGAYVLMVSALDETPVDTWVNNVEVVSDLKPGEAPYVVHQITYTVPNSYDGKSPLCTRYHSSQTKCSVNVDSVSTKATIHIPEGSYDQYVKVS
jgi:hypothetical protein